MNPGSRHRGSPRAWYPGASRGESARRSRDSAAVAPGRHARHGDVYRVGEVSLCQYLDDLAVLIVVVRLDERFCHDLRPPSTSVSLTSPPTRAPEVAPRW